MPEGEVGTRLAEEYAKDEATILVNVLAAVGEETIIAFKSVQD